MTDAEKKELDALKAKGDKATDEDKARMAELEAKAGEKTYSEDYVKTLRTEAAQRRMKVKELEEKLAKFDGIDPDEYQKLLDNKKELEKKKLMDAGEFETLRKQLVEENSKELAKRDEEKAALMLKNQQLADELDLTILRHEISTAAVIAKALNPSLVEMVVLNQAKVDMSEDGKRLIKVLDSKGDARIDIKTGEPIKIITLLEEMKQSPEYAMLFSGGKAGAGSGTLQYGGKSIDNPWKKETFNLTLQGKIFKENRELAMRLKSEAGVK